MDMTATPTTFHAFKSPELESASVAVAVLVAAGVGVDALVVDDVGCTAGVAAECTADVLALVLVLVLILLVEKSPLSMRPPPVSVLCDFDSERVAVLLGCDVSDGSRPSRPGRESDCLLRLGL
jgi:hypothetical protein